MRHRICNAPTLLAFAALSAAGGCGASRVPVAPVEGVVTRGGKPLAHLRVQFMPDGTKGTKGPTSSGTTDDQGHFKLACADGRAGAVVGWHKVVVNDMKIRLPRATRHGAAGEDGKGKTGNADDDTQKPVYQPPRVPEQYTTSAKTPLTLEVQADGKDMTLDLK